MDNSIWIIENIISPVQFNILVSSAMIIINDEENVAEKLKPT